jgi:hypothetical protein
MHKSHHFLFLGGTFGISGGIAIPIVGDCGPPICPTGIPPASGSYCCTYLISGCTASGKASVQLGGVKRPMGGPPYCGMSNIPSRAGPGPGTSCGGTSSGSASDGCPPNSSRTFCHPARPDPGGVVIPCIISSPCCRGSGRGSGGRRGPSNGPPV